MVSYSSFISSVIQEWTFSVDRIALLKQQANGSNKDDSFNKSTEHPACKSQHNGFVQAVSWIWSCNLNSKDWSGQYGLPPCEQPLLLLGIHLCGQIQALAGLLRDAAALLVAWVFDKRYPRKCYSRSSVSPGNHMPKEEPKLSCRANVLHEESPRFNPQHHQV